MSKPVLAYHFTDGYHLRDGAPLEVGREYVFDGEPVMCECGYHASRHVFDALKYAPGSILSRVECREITDECDDKIVCKRRTVIQTIDATDLLLRFARMCALDVIHLWEAPDIVIRYLKTGDESLRDAARSAAWEASSASSARASGAASSAEAAAWSAAWEASSAAWDVAWDTGDSARAATRDAAWAAARSIGWDAARSVGWDAASAIARDTAMRRQRRRLARMVTRAFKKWEES